MRQRSVGNSCHRHGHHALCVFVMSAAWCARVVRSYVATLSLVDRATGGSGLALSAIVLLHFLPMLLLAPISGVVADSVNRVRILICAALFDSVAAGALVLVSSGNHLAWLYVLLFLQFSAWSFYNPARAALVPVVVHPDALPAATTIDTFAWSLTAAIGASLGGFTTSHLGIPACFALVRRGVVGCV